jgi:hypothetical protein
LRPEIVADLPVSSSPIAVPGRRRSVLAAMIAAPLAMLVIAVVTWWIWPTTRSSPTLPAVVAGGGNPFNPKTSRRTSPVDRGASLHKPEQRP